MFLKTHTLGTRTLCPSETDVRLVMTLLKKKRKELKVITVAFKRVVRQRCPIDKEAVLNC